MTAATAYRRVTRNPLSVRYSNDPATFPRGGKIDKVEFRRIRSSDLQEVEVHIDALLKLLTNPGIRPGQVAECVEYLQIVLTPFRTHNHPPFIRDGEGLELALVLVLGEIMSLDATALEQGKGSTVAIAMLKRFGQCMADEQDLRDAEKDLRERIKAHPKGVDAPSKDLMMGVPDRSLYYRAARRLQDHGEYAGHERAERHARYGPLDSPPPSRRRRLG